MLWAAKTYHPIPITLSPTNPITHQLAHTMQVIQAFGILAGGAACRDTL